MIEQLYKDISDQLAAKVPALRWIDIEYGQLEIPTESYPVQFPATLIDFPTVDFENETFGNQQATVNVGVRLALDLYEDFHVVDGQEAPDQETAINRLTIISEVHAALHGFETDYCTPLIRRSLMMERRDDGLKVIGMMYATMAKDDSAAKVYKEITGAAAKVDKV